VHKDGARSHVPQRCAGSAVHRVRDTNVERCIGAENRRCERAEDCTPRSSIHDSIYIECTHVSNEHLRTVFEMYLHTHSDVYPYMHDMYT